MCEGGNATLEIETAGDEGGSTCFFFFDREAFFCAEAQGYEEIAHEASEKRLRAVAEHFGSLLRSGIHTSDQATEEHVSDQHATMMHQAVSEARQALESQRRSLVHEAEKFVLQS